MDSKNDNPAKTEKDKGVEPLRLRLLNEGLLSLKQGRFSQIKSTFFSRDKEVSLSYNYLIEELRVSNRQDLINDVISTIKNFFASFLQSSTFPITVKNFSGLNKNQDGRELFFNLVLERKVNLKNSEDLTVSDKVSSGNEIAQTVSTYFQLSLFSDFKEIDVSSSIYYDLSLEVSQLGGVSSLIEEESSDLRSIFEIESLYDFYEILNSKDFIIKSIELGASLYSPYKTLAGVVPKKRGQIELYLDDKQVCVHSVQSVKSRDNIEYPNLDYLSTLFKSLDREEN